MQAADERSKKDQEAFASATNGPDPRLGRNYGPALTLVVNLYMMGRSEVVVVSLKTSLAHAGHENKHCHHLVYSAAKMDGYESKIDKYIVTTAVLIRDSVLWYCSA